MSRIDELIQELCPDGVKIATLDELCEVANNKRKPVKSDLRTSGTIPYYGANNIQDYVEGHTHDGEYVLIAEDGSASLSNYSVQFAVGKFWANNHVHVVRGKDGVDNRFLFHYFGAMNFMPYLTGGTRAKLNKSKLLEIKIPIPPLEVQKEIASILDKFTQLEAELSAELSAELDARRKQYDFYRNYLLKLDTSGSVDHMMVGDICKLVRGRRLVKSELEQEGEYAVYQNSMTPLGYYDKSNFSGDTTFIISAGAAGEIGYSPTDFWAADDVYVLQPSESVKSRFLYHALENQKRLLSTKVRRASIPRLSRISIEKLSIPVPSLEQQDRIVTILDQFDTLVNDISSGIPAEINARRKQYEYYRTKLLTFQELPA